MKTCLVVDDSPMDLVLLNRCITKLGLDVTIAASGDAAFEACKNKLPDCMVIDWEMPGMNGIELLKKIRSLENAGSIFIIVCTSHDQPSFVGHAYVQGASAYLVKPATPISLKAHLIEGGIITDSDA